MADKPSAHNKKLTPEEQLQEKPADFLIAGIGASAGGVQALQDFFSQVPGNSGIAYVVILHLSPDFDSQLATILQRIAQIPVTQVAEKTSIQPNHVYVIPPNKHLSMSDGCILVAPNTNTEERRASVDIFFRTLADEHGPRSIGIILSGTGANGSMGLKRIKERGGAVFVQNPREAEFNEMPRNAIATELVDEVLKAADIPAKLIAYRNSLGKIQITEEAEKRPEDEQQALREIFTQIRLRTGHDFSNYKRPTLLRRIERRISIHNLPDLPAYARYLHDSADEAQALLKDLLISVTNFFRDKKPFEMIENDILPLLLKAKNGKDQLRIWVAGCATGEEAYSLAMLCAEKVMDMLDAPRVQVFATDIDESAIAQAREGLYTLNDAADVSPERLRRFFHKEGESYRIRREIREMIMFAHHNFLKDPPFSHLDLISCRNVMIYLNNVAQERVIETFHFALNPGCYLFLGTSESVDGATDLYAVHNRENHIYQSRQTGPRSYPVPEASHILFTEKNKTANGEPPESKTLERISFGDLHQQLLEEYAAPSVVVNEEHDIVHLTEKAGRYLHFAGGEPSKNLLKLIKPELRLELRSALYQSVQRKTSVEAKGLKVKVDDKPEVINIHVKPVLRFTDTARGYILVLFEPSTRDDKQEKVVLTTDEPVAKQLEEELIHLKGRLRAANEQHEYQAEEMKANNEELQAINEELRSAAEELETSKEELQSINEELRTVNQELKVKIEETGVANNNLQNLINSTDVGTIFLDRGFRIALFTPSAREIFNLIPADYGRSLSDITNNLDYPSLMQDAETVLDKLKIIEREVHTKDNREYLMRITPYRTDEDRIKGVVITFLNITERRQADEALRLSEEKFRTMAAAAPALVWICAPTGENIYFNQRWYDFTGQTREEAAGYGWSKAAHPDDWALIAPYWERCQQTGEVYEGEIRYRRYDGEWRWFGFRALPMYNAAGAIEAWHGLSLDVTERKKAEEEKAADMKDLQTLHDLSTKRVPEEARQVLFNEILEAGISIARADAGTVQILDDEKQELKLLAAYGFSPEMMDYFKTVSAASNTSCGKALANNTRIFVDYDDPTAADPDGSMRRHLDAGYLSSQSTPLINRFGKAIGMITTHSKRHKYRLSERELRYIDLLVRQAADLIEQLLVKEALQQNMAELTRFNNLMVDRELTMIGLKKEVNKLLREAGKAEKYPLVFENEGADNDAG